MPPRVNHSDFLTSYINPAGATISIISLRPPNAPAGSPPPIILPNVVISSMCKNQKQQVTATNNKNILQRFTTIPVPPPFSLAC